MMRGNEYIAPCTGLHLIPGTMFRMSSVSLAFCARSFSVVVRSYTAGKSITLDFNILKYNLLNCSLVNVDPVGVI